MWSLGIAEKRSFLRHSPLSFPCGLELPLFQCETGGTRTDRERHLYPILLIYKRTTMVQETRTEVRLKLGVLGMETGNELVYLIFVNKAIVSLLEGTESR